MATRRLQEVTNDPTAPVLTIDDSTGAIKAGDTSINTPGSSAPTAAANTVVAGPTTGSPATATARALVIGDIPAAIARLASPTFTGTVKLPGVGAHELVYALSGAGDVLGDADLKFDPTIDELSGPALVIKPGQFTVGTLPTGAEGQIAYATDGRKVGEGAGVGTGVPVYFSNTKWRVYSTDAEVAA